MRNVDIIILRQIWKAVQAITRNSDYLCTCSNSTVFKVLTNDIKNSSFQNFWMSRNRTRGGNNPESVLLQLNELFFLNLTLDERHWQYENV